MLRNTKPSDAESHTECDKADGFGPIRYRILDTRTENFWDANFTSVASVGKNFVPASPAGAVACQCTCANDIRFHTFFATRAGAALNSQTYAAPTLRDGETTSAGYKNLARATRTCSSNRSRSTWTPTRVTGRTCRSSSATTTTSTSSNPSLGTTRPRLAQRRTLVHAQAYDEWAGNGGTIGTALRSAKTDGDGVVEDARTAGALSHGLPLGVRPDSDVWGYDQGYDHNYVPGFHFESNETVTPGRYVVTVFRTCSNGPGHCDETARDDAGKSFQFKITAQVIRRSSFQWEAVDSRVSDNERDSHKRGSGTTVVTVADRYVCMFGGPTGVDASTGAPFAVYDAVEDKTTTPSDGFDYLHIAFAVAVEDKSFVPSGNLVGAFIMTHAYHHGGGVDRSLQPYAVRRVTISHATGSDPGVAVTEIYPAVAAAGMPARFGSAGVWYDDKILVHGGFHVDGTHALVATSCVENPTDAVWAFDMNTFQWFKFAGPTRPNGDGTFAPAIPEPVGVGTRRRCLTPIARPAPSTGPLPRIRRCESRADTPRSRAGFRAHQRPLAHLIRSVEPQPRHQSVDEALDPEHSDTNARDSATARVDHSLIVLGESTVVMTGGQCRTTERCKDKFVLAQPLGPDPTSQILTNVTLGVYPVTYMHDAKPKMTNKAVMAGAYVYLLSFGDYESYGQNTEGAAVGYIWRYKLVSHVKNAAPAVDDADADRGSQAAPYRTLKYAINRGQAPVVVLMTGSHEGVGNANVVVAGPSMGKAPVNDGYGSPATSPSPPRSRSTSHLRVTRISKPMDGKSDGRASVL